MVLIFRGQKLRMTVLLVLAVFSTYTLVQGAPIRNRTPRDLLNFLKEAGNAVRRAGENALRAILPKVMNSGLIPGTRADSQKTTQPRGPNIPLNAINEDAINPVIPNKRSDIADKRQKSDVNRLNTVLSSKSTGKGDRANNLAKTVGHFFYDG